MFYLSKDCLLPLCLPLTTLSHLIEEKNQLLKMFHIMKFEISIKIIWLKFILLHDKKSFCNIDKLPIAYRIVIFKWWKFQFLWNHIVDQLSKGDLGFLLLVFFPTKSQCIVVESNEGWGLNTFNYQPFGCGQGTCMSITIG